MHELTGQPVLVDLEGKPKPAFYAFKEGVARLRS